MAQTTLQKILLPIKVAPVVVNQFDAIQSQEGFGNRASTFTYLVKFYWSKQWQNFEHAADGLERVLSKIPKEKIPSLKKQLGL